MVAVDAQTMEALCLNTSPRLVLVDVDKGELRASVGFVRRYFPGFIVGMTLRGQSSTEAVQALLNGVDLVMTKPFTREALLAQLDAINRRQFGSMAFGPQSLYVNGAFKFDFLNHIVEVDERRVHLSSIQYRLLEALTRNPDAVLTHAQLIDMVWGSTEESSSENLRAHVHNLRQILNDIPPRLIRTERDIGYYVQGGMLQVP